MKDTSSHAFCTCWQRPPHASIAQFQVENVPDGPVYCPEVVKYFVWTYATHSAIRNSTKHLENIRRNSNETENLCASRIGDADADADAAYRFGKFHTDNEKISVFTKVLVPSVRPVAEGFRREQPSYGLTFNGIVAFSCDEGDSKRARTQ